MPDTSSYPGFTPPPFKVNAEPRTMKTGAEVAVFGGIDFLQSGPFKETYANGSASAVSWPTARTHDGEVFGAKVGYTWPAWGKGPGFTSSSVPLEVDEDSGPQLLPSVEAEFFYSNHKFEARGPFFGRGGVGAQSVDEGDLRASMREYVFTVNPVLRAQVWRFRPYVGAGIGGAIVQLQDATMQNAIPQTGVYSTLNTSPSDQYTLCLATQFMAGSDFFVTRNISLFGEYKFLALISPGFKGAGGYNLQGDYYGENIATAGVRYHF